MLPTYFRQKKLDTTWAYYRRSILVAVVERVQRCLAPNAPRFSAANCRVQTEYSKLETSFDVTFRGIVGAEFVCLSTSIYGCTV
jgi:hypothetical protein